jgi:hypothetical protein
VEGEWYGKEDLKYAVPYLGVHVLQDWREIAPRVHLGFMDGKTGWDLTPGEARAVAEQLTKGADLADGHGGAE